MQCMVRACGDDGLRAHRALDDVVALRRVLERAGGRVGVSVSSLISPFVFAMDVPGTVAQLSGLLDA